MKNKTDSFIKVFPLSKLFPNIITLLALCVGLTSLRYALDGKWEQSVILLLVAAFLDSLDGRIARYLNVTSDFGANLDSLADFINFGISPAILIYLWVLNDIRIKGVGWGFVLIYSICCAVRLARFNVSIKSHDKLKDSFFTGINAPMGAVLAIMPMVLTFEFDDANIVRNPWFIGVYLTIVAFGMASRIPTFSIKNITVSHTNIRLILAFFGLLIAGLIIKPWMVVAFVSALYIVSIPVSALVYYRLSSKGKRPINHID